MSNRAAYDNARCLRGAYAATVKRGGDQDSCLLRAAREDDPSDLSPSYHELPSAPPRNCQPREVLRLGWRNSNDRFGNAEADSLGRRVG